MAFRLPVFNLVCRVWRGALPADLVGGVNLLNLGPPLHETSCQLYFSRYGPGGWFHAWPDSVRVTLERAGYIDLRCPRDTDIRAPWFPTTAITWHDLDLVEVPAGSGRFYVAVLVEQAHAGFANEYRVAVLAQLANVPGLIGAGGGGGADLVAVPGSGFGVEGGGGGGASSGLGVALGVEGGGGGGADLVAVPGSAAKADAGGGGGADLVAVPGSAAKADAGGGGGDDVVGTFTAGTVGPGANCAAASLTGLALNYSGSINPGSQAWWYFHGVAGTTYHLRLTAAGGSFVSGTLYTGACGVQTTQVNVTAAGVVCGSFVLGSTQDVYIEVSGGFVTTAYTVEVDTGTC